jgi:hypothetical protein
MSDKTDMEDVVKKCWVLVAISHIYLKDEL